MRFLAGPMAAPLAGLFALCLRAFAAVAIQDVTVIDVVSGTPRPHQTVIIERDRIAAIGPAASTAIREGATIVNGKGKFLIPGLWDMRSEERRVGKECRS